MNIDNGSIVLWNDLSDEQKESGRWIKLGDGEFATAADIPKDERPERLNKIFAKELKALARKEFEATDFRKLPGSPNDR